MPKKLEHHLDEELKNNPKYKNLSEERKNAIKYGVMRKTGWKPSKAGTEFGTDEPEIFKLEEENYRALYRFTMALLLG